MNIPLGRYWNLLVDYLRAQRVRFVLLAGLLLGSIGLQIVNPQIMRFFIDTALGGEPTDTLMLAGLLFIAIAIVQQVVAVSATYVGENVAWNATNELRADLARHALHLDMSFHNDRSPGELIERIDGDVSELSNFFSQLVIMVLGNILLLAGIVLALALEDWRLGIVFAVFAGTTLYALNRVRSIAVPFDRALRESIADLFGFLEERLAGTEDIRSSGAVDFVLRGLDKLHTVILSRWQAAWNRHWRVRAVAGLMLMGGYGIAFVSGWSLFNSGAMTLGTAYLVVHYTNLIARPIREITRQVENLQNIGAAIERLEELTSIESKISDGPGADIPTGPLALAFDGVTFGYTEDEPVLDGISLAIQPGGVLGLLGRTGSGKTTLARLIFRLYDIQQGQITLGGVPVQQPTLADLRRRVALVTQDVQLFQASVRDNLTFFNRDIPDETVLGVIDELGLRSWFEQLPKGLDTRLETGGRGLSAGEGQLLAFTRVFLQNPGLVILDEASSRLDPATEQLIERAIDRLLRDRTAIIIAHRLGTVQRAEDILILDDGQIMEYGNREALAADPASRFYHLLQTGLEEVLA